MALGPNPGDMTNLPRRATKYKDGYRLNWTGRLQNGKAKEGSAYRSSEDECFAEAERKRTAFYKEQKGLSDPNETTLFELVDAYRATLKNVSAADTGYKTAITYIHKHFDDQDVLLANVTYKVAEKAFATHSHSKNSSEKALSFARRTFEWAITTDQWDKGNPFALVKLPKWKPKKRKRATDDALATLLAHPWTTEALLMFVLFLYGAFRIGELVALKWSDRTTASKIPDEDGSFPWKGDLTPMLYVQRKQPSKKGAGTNLKHRDEGEGRALTLTPFVIELLDRHRAEQLARGYQGDLIFPNTEHKMHTTGNFRSRWYNLLLLQAGLATKRLNPNWNGKTEQFEKKWLVKTDYCPHEFRHTGMTLRNELGVNIYMMEELGHKPQGISDVHLRYIHLSPKTRWDEAEKVGNLLQTLVSVRESSGNATKADVAA